MADAIGQGERAPDRGAAARWMAASANAARAAGPPLLFGLRLWASVCLALYVAFWLELDNAYWAGTSAAIVCQPHLGASLRKGWFRMIGTLIGAIAIIVLTACFPQDRAAFMVGLALWGAVCALFATVLRNFAAYAAALAGYTAAIIASDQLGATGGPNGDAFMLAIIRVSEIWIGIVCAGLVLAGTDFGGARRRLAAVFAAVSAEIVDGFGSTLTQQARRRPTRNSRFGASSCERSSRSTPWSTRRSENPRRFATIRRCCRGRWRDSWPRSGPGAPSRCGSRDCRIAWLANRPMRCCAIFRSSCGRPLVWAGRHLGWQTRKACERSVARGLGR